MTARRLRQTLGDIFGEHVHDIRISNERTTVCRIRSTTYSTYVCVCIFRYSVPAASHLLGVSADGGRFRSARARLRRRSSRGIRPATQKDSLRLLLSQGKSYQSGKHFRLNLKLKCKFFAAGETENAVAVQQASKETQGLLGRSHEASS